MFNDKQVIFLFVPGPMGGAEKIVAYGLKALLAAGVNAKLWIIKEERVPHVTEAFVKLLNSEAIPYKIFSAKSVVDLNLMKTLRLEFQRTNPDVIHAHGFKAAVYGNIAKNPSSSFVVTHHGRTGHTLKVRLYEFIELLVMKKADAVMAVSVDMKKMLESSGVKSEKLHVVENFMTTNSFPALSLNSDKLKFLFVGRLSPEKGCDILINALTKEMELSVVGDGIERQRLEELSQNLPVKFLGFQNDIPSIMSKHDVLVMPSHREGQPLTLIEACCMGMPVVASDVGGIPELITHNKNGLLFKAGDSQELRKNLIKIQNEFKIFSYNAGELKDKFRTRFSPKIWASKTTDVYLRSLSQE